MRVAHAFIIFGIVLTLIGVIIIMSAYRPPCGLEPVTLDEVKRDKVRKLWAEHPWWARNYIVATLNNSPDSEIAAQQLINNQDNIGAQLGSKTFSKLLRQHAQGTIQLIESTKAGSGVQAARETWMRNADAMADFLSKTIKSDVPWRDLIEKHVDLTETEVRARMSKDWDGDMSAFLNVDKDIERVANAIAANWNFSNKE